MVVQPDSRIMIGWQLYDWHELVTMRFSLSPRAWTWRWATHGLRSIAYDMWRAASYLQFAAAYLQTCVENLFLKSLTNVFIHHSIGILHTPIISCPPHAKLNVFGIRCTFPTMLLWPYNLAICGYFPSASSDTTSNKMVRSPFHVDANYLFHHPSRHHRGSKRK